MPADVHFVSAPHANRGSIRRSLLSTLPVAPGSLATCASAPRFSLSSGLAADPIRIRPLAPLRPCLARGLPSEHRFQSRGRAFQRRKWPRNPPAAVDAGPLPLRLPRRSRSAMRRAGFDRSSLTGGHFAFGSASGRGERRGREVPNECSPGDRSPAQGWWKGEGVRNVNPSRRQSSRSLVSGVSIVSGRPL
jgi:hypothetical protein